MEQKKPAEAIKEVVSLNSEVRRLLRDTRGIHSELQSTKLVLEITQEELELANQELEEKNKIIDEFRGKLARLEAKHWERHQILHEELMTKHKREVRSLKKELDFVKGNLALRNRQVAHWAGHAMKKMELRITPSLPTIDERG